MNSQKIPLSVAAFCFWKEATVLNLVPWVKRIASSDNWSDFLTREYKFVYACSVCEDFKRCVELHLDKDAFLKKFLAEDLDIVKLLESEELSSPVSYLDPMVL